jgi:adenylate cyclase
MTDSRLHSVHLVDPIRREEFRRRRTAVFGAEGWMTRIFEHIPGWVPGSDDWPVLLPVRPEQLLPGTKFLLFEPETGRWHPLRTGVNTLGRFPDNDVFLDETEVPHGNCVSRRHGVILVHARGGCELHDLASLNGTFVNGRRITQPVFLRSRDVVRVCHRELVFVAAEDCAFEGEGESSGTAVLQ